MRALVTGFEPFGPFTTNPSAQVAEALACEDVVSVVLPVVFDGLAERITSLIEEHRPDVVLSLGLAAGQQHLDVERVGINLVDASLPDNAGEAPVDAAIVEGAPAAYFATLPVKAMAEAMRVTGVQVALSTSAGTYGCNLALYAALEFASRMPERTRPRCGFIHLPTTDDVSLDAQITAVRAALAAADDEEQHYAAGTLN